MIFLPHYMWAENKKDAEVQDFPGGYVIEDVTQCLTVSKIWKTHFLAGGTKINPN